MIYNTIATETAPANTDRGRLAAAAEGGSRIDVLLRFSLGGTVPQFLGLLPTEDALSAASRLHRANRVLADAVVNCGRYMEYASHYMAFLSSQIDESEFQAIAREYAVAPVGDIAGLAERIAVILRETGIVFPPEQLEEICAATSSEVEAALGLLAEGGYVVIER